MKIGLNLRLTSSDPPYVANAQTAAFRYESTSDRTQKKLFVCNFFFKTNLNRFISFILTFKLKVLTGRAFQ